MKESTVPAWRRPRNFRLANGLRGQCSIARGWLVDRSHLKIGRKLSASISTCREPVSLPEEVPLTARPGGKMPEQRDDAMAFDSRPDVIVAHSLGPSRIKGAQSYGACQRGLFPQPTWRRELLVKVLRRKTGVRVQATTMSRTPARETAVLFLLRLWTLHETYLRLKKFHVILDNFSIHSSAEVQSSLQTPGGR